MTPFLQLAFVLAVILLCAKLAGYISNRIGQPSVLGELLVGLLLGPSLINLINLPFLTDDHLIVGMVLATTLVTPPMLRALFPKKKTRAIFTKTSSEPEE